MSPVSYQWNSIHILTDINPSLATIDFVKDIKVSTSLWMKNSALFPAFNGWSVGYGSFTCLYSELDRLIDYIKNQQEHNRSLTFEEEYRNLLLWNGINPDESLFPLLRRDACLVQHPLNEGSRQCGTVRIRHRDSVVPLLHIGVLFATKRPFEPQTSKTPYELCEGEWLHRDRIVPAARRGFLHASE